MALIDLDDALAVVQYSKSPIEGLKNLPRTEDVVHGRWITDEKGVAYCGRCRIIDDYASVHNYCPNCGARMDGE